MVHHVVVVENLVEALIADMRSSVHGELSSRSQIVDHLLDLRLACRDSALALAMVDRLLGELPGRTTVPNAWWLEALLDIERSLRSGVTVGADAPARRAAPGPTPLPKRRPQA